LSFIFKDLDGKAFEVRQTYTDHEVEKIQSCL
jgi:hypothetical protein